MILEEALIQLATDLDFDPEDLIGFAYEDDEDGWDGGQGSWGIGSLFRSEGQLLYALVRAMRPKRVLELGVKFGCSSKHILMALVKNRRGKLVSVDWIPQADMTRFTRAERRRWQIIHANAYECDLPRADIAIEDLEHDEELTRLAVARLKALQPALILTHDALHPYVGEAVRDGFIEAIGDIRLVETFDEPEEPNRGFGYWKMSDEIVRVRG